MHRVAVVGAGQIGDLIATLLAGSGDYDISLFDASDTQLARICDHPRLRKGNLDATNRLALQKAVKGHQVIVNAAPYHLTESIASAAAHRSVHYMDLTEDVASARAVRTLASAARSSFIPQCGLAPGIVSSLAADMAREFDELDTVKLKVGALPRFPSNALSYNMTWSPEGVVNEYCNPCAVIVNGRRMAAPPLEQREILYVDGDRYESFNTSGGLGSLATSWAGKVRNLSYQSIRYPGHARIMRALLRDLGLSNRRELLLDILAHAVPATHQDMVIIFIAVSGMRNGRLEQTTYTNKILGNRIAGREYTAIQLCTASSACAVLDLLLAGHIRSRGYVRQEEIDLAGILSNRFGRVFETSRQSAQELAMVV